MINIQSVQPIHHNCALCGGPAPEGIRVTLEANCVSVDGRVIPLTRSQADLLFALAGPDGIRLATLDPEYLSAGDLYLAIYGANPMGSEALRQLIFRVRQLLADTRWRIDHEDNRGWALRYVGAE
jgi:hypothetical protein